MEKGQHCVASVAPLSTMAADETHALESARAPVQSGSDASDMHNDRRNVNGEFRVEFYEVGDANEASLLISFPLLQGGRGELRISRGQLVNTNRAKTLFADAGAQLPLNCKACFDVLLNDLGTSMRHVTSKGGWHENEFVTAFGSFGSAPDHRVTQLQTTLWAKRASGSQGRRGDFVAHIDPFLRVSDYLLLSYIAALTPPVASRIGRTGGFGLCFSSESSTGKTLAIRLAQSLVARGDEADLYNFGDTDGSIQDSLPLFGGLCITFADVKAEKDHRAALTKLGSLAFNAVGGLVRQRKGEAERPRPQFLGILLSVERPLAELFQDHGIPFEGGEGVRLIDIPVPELHEGGIFAAAGSEHSAEWAAALNELLGDTYGCVMRPWADVLSRQQPDEIAASVKVEERRFLGLLGKQPDGQLDRIAQQFALFATVGRHASRLGLLKLSAMEIDDALSRIFWRAADRFRNRDREVVDLWNRLFDFIEDRSRFPLVERGRAPFELLVEGFRRIERSVEYVYVRGEVLTEHFPDAGFIDRIALPRLLRLGALVRQEAQERSVPVSQFGFGRHRCYRFIAGSLASARREIGRS